MGLLSRQHNFFFSVMVYLRAVLNGRPVTGNQGTDTWRHWLNHPHLDEISGRDWIRIIPVEIALIALVCVCFCLISWRQTHVKQTVCVLKWPSASSQQMAMHICPTYFDLKHMVSVHCLLKLRYASITTSSILAFTSLGLVRFLKCF